LEEEKKAGRLSEIIKIGGYLIAAGALVGFSQGTFLLFNRELFSFFLGVSQFEVMSYFLGVFTPSFVVLIIVGYLFATTLRLKKVNLSSITFLCALSLLCMVLSALSVFYLISFFGGLVNLIALLRAFTKPSFKILSEEEAFFLTELGAMFVAVFSALYLVMLVVSNVFQTYPMSFSGTYSPYALLLVGVLSFLMFFAVSLWGSSGMNAGFNGVFGLIMSVLSYLLVIQNRFVLFNMSASIGIFLVVAGLISALAGNLVYLKLFFVPIVPAPTPKPSLLFRGKVCPYCGKPRATSFQSSCSGCGRSLMWTPYAPFCPSCGLLISTNVQTCPHCLEDIGSRKIQFHLEDEREQAIVNNLSKELTSKKSRAMKGPLKTLQTLGMVGHGLRVVFGFVELQIERLSLTVREALFIFALTYLFSFLSFIGPPIRVDPYRLPNAVIVWVYCYGFPLEWLRAKATYPKVEVLWASLILDVLLYFVIAFFLVYGVSRLRR